jgi:hypothetical protein
MVRLLDELVARMATNGSMYLVLGMMRWVFAYALLELSEYLSIAAADRGEWAAGAVNWSSSWPHAPTCVGGYHLDWRADIRVLIHISDARVHLVIPSPLGSASTWASARVDGSRSTC